MASDAVKCLRHNFRVAHMTIYFHAVKCLRHMLIYFHVEHMLICVHVADSLLYNLTQRAFDEPTLAPT
jgi:hypothetical protein